MVRLSPAPSSHYAFFTRHACSARLRFCRHVLLLPKKSKIFWEPCIRFATLLPKRRGGLLIAKSFEKII